jgi:hypothetical protein
VDRGELKSEPEPLAAQVLTVTQGGLLMSQARRDPVQMRIATDAAMTLIDAAWAEPDRRRSRSSA